MPAPTSTLTLTETSTLTLTELMAAARCGDPPAIEEIVRRHERRLHQVAGRYRLPQADRHDAVQSTWLRLVENLDRIRDPERLGAWLATTTRRECLRLMRLAAREDPAETDVLDEHADERFPRPDRAAVDRLMSEALWEQVDSLSDSAATLLRALHATDQLPYAEVARQLGMPVGSLGPTRGRCIVRLRRTMERAGLGREAWA